MRKLSDVADVKVKMSNKKMNRILSLNGISFKDSKKIKKVTLIRSPGSIKSKFIT